MRISLIVAMAENRVIGAGNDLPWRLPEDLKRVRALTTGHHIILGRRNYESIGKPLPNRTNIVLSRQPGYVPPAGCLGAASLDEALTLCAGDSEVFIFGGAEIYRTALPRTERMYLTLVHATVPGDTLFPEFDWADWQIAERTDHDRDERHAYPYSFLTLDRKR